ncbi:MAG: hypothetical protein Q9167_004120 [Letrouitia subvulpina]
MDRRQDTTVPEVPIRCGGIVEAFFNTLSPNEKELFKATIVAEQLLEEVQVAEKDHKDKSISRKAAQALKPFLAGINQYGMALDVISNGSSLVLCPLWGGVRIILHLATEFGEYFEKLSAMLQQIGLNLNSLRRFPRLYPHNRRLEVAMVDVYQVIFRFCTEARNVFKKANDKNSCKKALVGLQSMLKLVWKPFKIQFGDLQDELSACMERVSHEVEIAEKEEAHMERERAETERRAQASRWDKTEHTHQKLEVFFDEQSIAKVDQWLGPVDFVSNHEAAARLRHRETGRWFLDGDPFRHWLQTDNSFLWLHAIPGAGKTVLISSVIEHLKEHIKRPDVGLAYFYCDYREIQKQEPSRILCTLLAQLARQHKTIFQRLQAFIQERIKENPASTPRHDELRGNFAHFLEGTLKQIVLVVDALDESTQRKCLIGDFKTFIQACPMVKIMVSSREELDIIQSFRKFPQVKINQVDVASDIESFVNAEVAARIRDRTLKIRRSELQQTICDTLVNRSEGMFQWVKCQIEVLSSLGTDKAILKALDQMPKDLSGTYGRILQRLEQESEHAERVQKLLKWLVRSTRSLTLDELAECVGIDLDEENEEMDFDSVETDPEDLLKRCSSLVTVSNDGRVSLAHYTVKEFLVSDSTRETLNRFYVGNEEVEAELAKTCLTYLCYSDFIAGSVSDEDDVQQLLDKYKLLNYAASSWAIHAHRCKDEEVHLQDLIIRLLQSQSEGRGNCELWNQVYQYSKASHRFTEQLPFNAVFFASSVGLPRTLENILANTDEPDRSDWLADDADPIRAAIMEGHTDVVQILLKHYHISDHTTLGAYLYVAALKGHESTVRLILDQGIDIDISGGKQGTALQIATLEGHKDVVQCLLSKKANTKIISPRFGTPLAAAAEKGHERTFQLLLNAGASINGKGGWYSYPLISAIVGRNDTIIQILLNKGANVNLTGGRHVCALMAAAAIGKLELVQKLIERGAKVNDENDKGADALHAACCAGRLEVVELLLENDADVNAKGGKHRNALNAASSEGFHDIVKTLLGSGADASAFDSNYGNAMQAAALRGHGDIVRTLSESGCDVNADGGIRGTALVCAASTGQVHILEMLFEMGTPKGDCQNTANAVLAATAKGHERAIELLVTKGANLNTPGILNTFEWTPLQLAANKGQFDMVSTILRLGADPNVVAGFHGTALMASSDSDKPNRDILEALIVAGADINQIVSIEKRSRYPGDRQGYGSALAAAAACNQLDTIRILLGHGADPNLVNGFCHFALANAARVGNEEMIEHLLLHNANVNLERQSTKSKDDDGIATALQSAAFYSTENIVRLLVAKGAKLTAERDDNCFKSALHAASYAGQDQNVKALLGLGSNVNLIGGRSGTCLQGAASQGWVETVKILLDSGADVNESKAGKSGSALMAAIDCEKHEVVKVLLERGADPSLRAKTMYQFPIQAAAYHGNEETVQLLIDAGADVNARGGLYHTALQAAASEGDDDTMKILIDAGAEVNICGGFWGNALSAAYREGYYICTGMLWHNNVSRTLSGGRYGSPLGVALSGACQTLITFLIKDHGADPNRYLTPHCGSPLHLLIYMGRGDDDVLGDLFLQYGADPNGLGPDGMGGYFGTPLNAAAARGNIERVKTLIEKGADPNLRANQKEWTSLQLACLFQHDDVFKLLLEHGCDVNAHGKYGTPLQAAAYRGKKSMVRDLLHRGADIKVSNQGRYGHALQAAAIRGHDESVRFLVKHGADVNVRGGWFGTVLQAASARCPKETIEFLIHRGANVNEKGGRYQTALQAAAVAGRKDVVRTLLEHKADVNIRGGKYGSALQAACVYGNLLIVRMLVEHGADVSAQGGFYGSAIDAAALTQRNEIVQYLVHEAGVKQDKINRECNHAGRVSFDRADEILKEALEASKNGSEDYWKSKLKDSKGALANADDSALTLMNVDSIPVYDSTTAPPEDAASSTSSTDRAADTESMATSVPDDAVQLQNAPMPKKNKKHLQRKKNAMVEETKEVSPSDEDMSALSWLQVECGYGGDLNGPGR